MRLIHLPDGKPVSSKKNPLVPKYMARRVLCFSKFFGASGDSQMKTVLSVLVLGLACTTTLFSQTITGTGQKQFLPVLPQAAADKSGQPRSMGMPLRSSAQQLSTGCGTQLTIIRGDSVVATRSLELKDDVPTHRSVQEPATRGGWEHAQRA